MIVGDQLCRCIDGLCRFGLVVRLNEGDLFAIDAAGIIGFFDRELQPFERRCAVVRRVAGHFKVCADADLVRVRRISSAAGKCRAKKSCADECSGKTQGFSSESHGYTPLDNAYEKHSPHYTGAHAVRQGIHLTERIFHCYNNGTSYIYLSHSYGGRGIYTKGE